MTIFEQTLRNYLIASNLVGQRVFLWRAPQVPAAQQQTPYMVFFHVAPTIHPVHGKPLTLLDRDYQVSIYDGQQTRVIGIADSLRQYLDGKTEMNWSGWRIGMIQYRVQTSGYEPQTKLYQVIQEYRIQCSFVT